LRGFESLKQKNDNGQDSLLYKMLDEANISGKRERWLTLSNFFWSITGIITNEKKQASEGKILEEQKQKILAFWQWTVDKQEFVKDKLGSEYSAFLGSMAELTILVEKINEDTEKWLMLSAPNLEKRHNTTFFVDYLARYEDDESIKRIGTIFLKVLEGTTPTFRREDIQLIVERLYNLKEKYPDLKKDADDICNTYGRRGVHFLKELYEKNQRK